MYMSLDLDIVGEEQNTDLLLSKFCKMVAELWPFANVGFIQVLTHFQTIFRGKHMSGA